MSGSLGSPEPVRVLVVDDDPAVRRLLASALASLSSAPALIREATTIAGGDRGRAGKRAARRRGLPRSARRRRLDRGTSPRRNPRADSRHQPPGLGQRRGRCHAQRRRRFRGEAVSSRRSGAPAGAGAGSVRRARRHRRPAPDRGHAPGRRLRRLHRRIRRDARPLRSDRPRRALEGAGVHHRRERHRQGSLRAGAARALELRQGTVHRAELRRHPARADGERNLRPREGRLYRRRTTTAPAPPSSRMAARCSSTKSARWISACRPSSCASSRPAPCGASATPRSARWTCASSAPPTAIRRRRWPKAASARTCFTGCMYCRCNCRRCANAPATWRCWRKPSSPASPRKKAARFAASTPKRRASSKPIPGPAMCASCRT